ncbi:hypothetical protein JCM30760_24380 [Thiomicrorhabdus hydrogeniphila]
MPNLHNVNTATESKNLLFVGIKPSQQPDIQQRLNDLNCTLTFCDTPSLALQLLKKPETPNFKAFIIDESLLKHDDFESFYNNCIEPVHDTIPMILQINPSGNYSVVKQALESGVYFSINHPYNSNKFKTVLMTANHSVTQFIDIESRQSSFEKVRALMQNAVFHVKTVQDARTLSSILAFMTPNQKRVSVGLFELIINAIEHGNLGIGYTEKSNLTMSADLQKEVERRLKSPENLKKYVTVTIKRLKDQMQFTIKDCGSGFDYTNYLDFSENRAMDHHGRGIMIANQLSFDHIEYKENGSKVICTVNL